MSGTSVVVAAAERVRQGGDERPARHGRRFPLVSLVTVYAFQGVGMWAVSLPLVAAQALPSPAGVTALDVVGVPLMEAHLSSTRPGYADYVRRTSAFFPRPPRPG